MLFLDKVKFNSDFTAELPAVFIHGIEGECFFEKKCTINIYRENNNGQLITYPATTNFYKFFERSKLSGLSGTIHFKGAVEFNLKYKTLAVTSVSFSIGIVRNGITKDHNRIYFHGDASFKKTVPAGVSITSRDICLSIGHFYFHGNLNTNNLNGTTDLVNGDGTSYFEGKEFDQNLTGASLGLNKLEVNKDAGDLYLGGTLTMAIASNTSTNPSGISVKLTKGKIVTGLNNSFATSVGTSFGYQNRVNGIFDGGGPNSYIDGKMSIIGNKSTMFYPVGKGAVYAPVTLARDNTSDNGVTSIAVEYVPVGFTGSFNYGSNYFDHDVCEHWAITFNTCPSSDHVCTNPSFKLSFTPTNTSCLQEMDNKVAIKLSTNSNGGMLATHIPYEVVSTNPNAFRISTSLATNATTYLTTGYKRTIHMDCAGLQTNSFSVKQTPTAVPLGSLTSGATGNNMGTSTYIRSVNNQNGYFVCHPNDEECLELTVPATEHSEALRLCVKTNTSGNISSVNILPEDTPLNPGLYKISGNTIQFFDEITESTLFEDFILNTAEDGITLTNSNSLTVKPPLGITINGFRINGGAYNGAQVTNPALLNIVVSNNTSYPPGSSNSVVLTVNDGTNTFDVQLHFIKP